ncbi:ABC transporter substrate-binding protein [Polaromonas sp. P1(28)-13]|nr:ABC transporter substrate-binding protein [Polaromonas sp. P1(28)-13]
MRTTSVRARHIAAFLVVGISFTFRTVHAADAVFGQIASTTHPASKANAEGLISGIQVYFASVNAKGGVNGRLVKLKSLDDGLEPKRMAELTETLIADSSVLGLVGYLNTPGLLLRLP